MSNTLDHRETRPSMTHKLTLKEIDREIARLQRQADKIRDSEKSEVVARIKKAVDYYGITAADLGLGKAARERSKAIGKANGKRRSSAGRVKYKDGTGRTWSGFGRKPGWFTEALANGKTDADLLA